MVLTGGGELDWDRQDAASNALRVPQAGTPRLGQVPRSNSRNVQMMGDLSKMKQKSEQSHLGHVLTSPLIYTGLSNY